MLCTTCSRYVGSGPQQSYSRYIARLGVKAHVIVQNGSKYILVVEVKEKQESDPFFFQLNGIVHQ